MSSEQTNPAPKNRTKDFKGNSSFEVKEVNGRRMLAMRTEVLTKVGQVASNDNKPGHAERESNPTVETVISRANSLVRDNNSLTKEGTTMQLDAWELYMRSPDGKLVIIEKVVPGHAKEGYALQDISITIERGSSSMPDQSIDFNYNQYGDKELRKSVYNGNENGVIETPGGASLEERISDMYTSIHHVYEGIANKKLEEQMGLSNLPVNLEDLVLIDDLLTASIVLDPSKGIDFYD